MLEYLDLYYKMTETLRPIPPLAVRTDWKPVPLLLELSVCMYVSVFVNATAGGYCNYNYVHDDEQVTYPDNCNIDLSRILYVQQQQRNTVPGLGNLLLPALTYGWREIYKKGIYYVLNWTYIYRFTFFLI